MRRGTHLSVNIKCEDQECQHGIEADEKYKKDPLENLEFLQTDM